MTNVATSLPAENIRPIDGPVSVLPAAQTETSAVMHMIERASRDPAVDIDKLQRLMEMREKIEMQAAERAFNTSMKGAQSEMRPIAADAENPQTKSRYASYAALDRALRPIYTKHGFALSFDEADSPKPEHIRVLCYVTHDAGFTRTYRKDMPADGKGAKGGDVMTKTHAAGSAFSYGQRYLLRMIFNIAIGNDDDGNAAGAEPPPKMTAEDLEILNKAIADTKTNVEQFLDFLQAETLDSLNLTQWNIAMNWLAQKQARAKKQAEAAKPT